MADAVKIFVYRNGRRVLEDLGTASIPSNIPAANITQDSTHQFLTTTEKNNAANAVTLSAVKTDIDIADSLTKKHSNTADHSHSNSSILGSITEAFTTTLKSAYDAVVSAAHSHNNKSTLDTYTQTEANLADAVTKKHANTFKCGIATKNITDTSTTQTIAHGLGRVPSVVRVKAHCVYAAAVSMIAEGVYDGTNHSGLCMIFTEGTSTATIDNIYSSTAAELGFATTGATNPYTGANRQTGVISVDATNITITWTKAGTVSSNVVNILWEVS